MRSEASGSNHETQLEDFSVYDCLPCGSDKRRRATRRHPGNNRNGPGRRPNRARSAVAAEYSGFPGKPARNRRRNTDATEHPGHSRHAFRSRYERSRSAWVQQPLSRRICHRLLRAGAGQGRIDALRGSPNSFPSGRGGHALRQRRSVDCRACATARSSSLRADGLSSASPNHCHEEG
jgi:hypothetical protein